jgi:threonine/homoserine/homoserine lactone efflux protein
MFGIHSLPQFVDPGTQFVFIPFLLLGMTFFTTGSIWCLVLVYGATWVTGRLRCRASIGGILKKAIGALIVGLGIKLAISGVQ